ncbi:hypothetical protein ACFL5V_08095 [Fibrobacterota bacterium]
MTETLLPSLADTTPPHPEIRQKLNKNSTVAKNNQAIRVLKKLGIGIHAHFIIHPEFTIQDFSDLYQYLCDKSLYRAAFPVLPPLPGTDLNDEVRDRILIKDYDFVDFCHALLPTRLKREEFYRQLANLYRKSYAPNRMLRFYYQKFFQSRKSPDFYAYHSDHMGFLKMLLVQLFAFPSYQRLKHACRTEAVHIRRNSQKKPAIPVSAEYEHEKKYHPIRSAT